MSHATQPRGATGLGARVLSVLLSLVFLGAGGAKLAGLKQLADNFARWGYPGWFLYVTGVIEVACAIGLWVPRVRNLAALGMVATMLGAALTHLMHGESSQSTPALVLAVLAGVLVVLRRDELLSRISPRRD